MSSLKDVYWMASPLAIDQRNCLNDKKIKGLRHLSRYIDPKNEIHVFRKIQHWTLEIGDKCYELSPNTKKKLRLIKKATDMIEPRWVEAIQWREIRESKKIEPEKRKIGQTRKTHDEIEAEVKFIWNNFNDKWYGFFTQNCQNFVHMLFQRIAVEIPKAGNGLWERIPDPVGYRLAEGARLALAGKIARGTRVAYLGAAAEAGQGLGSAGTMGAISGGVTFGGTAAAGSTGTMAAGSTAASGTIAAGGVTAGGTVGGTAAVGGTTAGTTTAGGGAVTGHVGIGAKAAALMHGGHAAAIGSGMAKAGAVAVFAHPITGIALTGGLAYLAIRGRRGKWWMKRNKKEEDMDVFDLLEGEEDASEQTENPKDVIAELNKAEQDIDQELAEDMKLKLVATEPGIVSAERGDVPVIQDTKRTQTTA